MGVSTDRLVYDPTDAETRASGSHVGSHTLDGAGTAITSTLASGKQGLDVNLISAIAVDLNGIYDVVTNPTPDNVGVIAHTRAASPAAAQQVERTTAGAASSDAVVAANVHGLDTNAFGMGYNGATWDRLLSTSGQLQVQPFGNVADDGVDAGAPIKVGQRAVSGALTAVSASGDRADQISDLYRRQWVNSSANIGGSNAVVSIDDTAGGTAVFATPLAGRRFVEVRNNGNKDIFLGFGTVTAAAGFPLHAGGVYARDLGPDIALKAIAGTGNTVDVRVLQFA